MATVLDPAAVAAAFRAELRAEIASLPEPLVVVGFLASEHGPSATYAEYTRKGCDDVGARFELRHVPRLDAEAAIRAANEDRGVHGMLVYYPIFGTGQDNYLRSLVDPLKDIEGLNPFWARCLYENRRFLDEAKTKKAILPCTPLAMIKLLDAAGCAVLGQARPLAGKKICVFNRSEVVGRPLASMLSNDGAEVFSFDIDGPQLFVPAPIDGAHEVREISVDRETALAQADIVITGIPGGSFKLISPREIKPGAVCMNFSTVKNFEDSIVDAASVLIPRVGPMTVTMALRNAVRLYRNR
ncbi:MAG: bifunctional methylenetetrahydrofolate dehydrogenase/methenyltetrahydrofolate cyclohydrolase [Polyangiaceae bacterium]